MRTKINLVALVFLLGVVGIAGCDKSKPDAAVSPAPLESVEPSASPEASVYEIVEIKAPAELPEIDLMKDLKIGWNLGNTMDSTTGSMLDYTYEISWQDTRTSQEIIDAVHEAGFNTIRIPVTWSKHCAGEDFNINVKWMDRVQEIVDYAMNAGMYAIVNIHHDDNEAYYYPDKDHLENSTHYVECIWNQIATRFIDYDEHLLFESINEPRCVGTAHEWSTDFTKPSMRESQVCINSLNQTFVDTVRKTGGNNASRYLLTPGYDAAPEGVLNNYFIMPKDPSGYENRIILSVHAYRPYLFAQADGNTSTFNEKNARDIDDFIEKLYDKYVSQGVPVIIGEFGARDKDNLEDRVAYAEYYIRKATEYGMVCNWWDNNAFTGDGENFGLLKRSEVTWIYPEIVEAMMRGLVDDTVE